VAAGQSVTHDLAPDRVAYLVPSTGSVVVDGVAVRAVEMITITATGAAELVLVDVPA